MPPTREEDLDRGTDRNCGPALSSRSSTSLEHTVFEKARAGARRFYSTEASNIEVENTDIIASTIHNAFDFDADLKTKLDLSSMENKKVKKLHETDLLCLDEISMMVLRRINILGIWYEHLHSV